MFLFLLTDLHEVGLGRPKAWNRRESICPSSSFWSCRVGLGAEQLEVLVGTFHIPNSPPPKKKKSPWKSIGSIGAYPKTPRLVHLRSRESQIGGFACLPLKAASSCFMVILVTMSFMAPLSTFLKDGTQDDLASPQAALQRCAIQGNPFTVLELQTGKGKGPCYKMSRVSLRRARTKYKYLPIPSLGGLPLGTL